MFGSNSFQTALATNGMVVVPTTTIPGVAGTKGSIQIAHTCGYGNVQAKAVALEPSTGFTFDTICMPRPDWRTRTGRAIAVAVPPQRA